MGAEFGRGVLAQGPGAEPLLPPLPDERTRPPRPHQVPQRTKAANPYSSAGFSLVKVVVVVAMLGAAVLGLAAVNMLPDTAPPTVPTTP